MEKIDRSNSQKSDRYEVRQLTREHCEWALAIMLHANIFCSTVWTAIQPEGKTARLYKGMDLNMGFVEHQIDSGMSFGVFDTEYKYNFDGSAGAGGRLHWDHSDLEADEDKLLEQMDFPLVSIALSYDQLHPLSNEQVENAVTTFPLYGKFFEICDKLDKNPTSWKAQISKEILMRNGTATRLDYEGTGLMKVLANFLMNKAKTNGYRGIKIECLHDAVAKVWLNPPRPYVAELHCEINMATYEEQGENGQLFKPFAPSNQKGVRIFVTL